MNSVLKILTLFLCFESHALVLRPVSRGKTGESFAFKIIQRNISQDHGGVYQSGVLPIIDSGRVEKKQTSQISKKEKIENKQLAPRSKPAPIQKVAKKAPKVVKRSKGQKKIQEMLEKNRQKLADRRGHQVIQGQGASKIQEALKRNRETLRRRKNEMNSPDAKELHVKNRRGLMRLKRLNTSTMQRWRDEQASFLKRVSQYKKALYKFDAPVISNRKLGKKRTIPFFESTAETAPGKKSLKKSSRNTNSNKDSSEILRTYVVDQAFETKITDQGKRPTCAAFSAIHAIEILLAQHNRYQKLSEQFFYYASKPKCRQSPCSRRGSWVNSGFKFTQNNPIPLQQHCPYKMSAVIGNETQIPLTSACFEGKVRVTETLELETLNDIAKALKQNIPVVGGFRLSENFYHNRGLVLLKDAQGTAKRNHSKGHAVTLIGVMELPKALRATEGDVCYLVANSWGTGWAIGGHACLSEAWFKSYRFPMAFVGVAAIEL
jgi:C1A family cysteine protease